MTIHPEYPNKIFAEYFQWYIDNSEYPNVIFDEDESLPASLRQAVEDEQNRIEEWLLAHYQEMKAAYVSDIEELFTWIRDEWPQHAKVRLVQPLTFTLDVAIAGERARSANSYTWNAGEIEVTADNLSFPVYQEVSKSLIDIAVQQIIQFLQNNRDDFEAIELYSDFEFGHNDKLSNAYWMATLYQDDPPPTIISLCFDESVISNEWVKLPLPPDIECLLTAAVDWHPARPETENTRQEAAK